MSDGSVLNGLGRGMKAFVAAEVALNSNFGELSRKNGAADTENIMTLADYMKKERPEKLKNWNPELRDDDKLMRTYVVPMVMPNGQRIDLVVNAKGRDIAQIYIDEEGDKRFHLDDSVKENIRIMTKGAIDKDKGYEREFIPKNLEELAEKISKDELVPKTQEDVAERKEKVDNEKLEGKEEKDDEKSLDEVAKEIGVPTEALEIFCKENDINPNSIKGSNIIQNTPKLQRQLGTKLAVPPGGEVIALRVNDIDASTKLAIIGLDGSTLDFNEEHDGERDEEKILSEIVPEGANGEMTQDTDEALKEKLELEAKDGNTNEVEAEINHDGDQAYFEERYNKIKEEENAAIEEINNDESLNGTEKARMIADLKADSYAKVESLQRETNIDSPELSKQELGEAQQAENEAEKSEVLKVGKDTVEAVGRVLGPKNADRYGF